MFPHVHLPQPYCISQLGYGFQMLMSSLWHCGIDEDNRIGLGNVNFYWYVVSFLSILYYFLEPSEAVLGDSFAAMVVGTSYISLGHLLEGALPKILLVFLGAYAQS